MMKMYIGLHVKCRLFLSDFNESLISRECFEKYSNTKFHENPSIGSRVVPCGHTNMTKLTAAFHSFANAPNKATKNYEIAM
jgi:hypothetical protein